MSKSYCVYILECDDGTFYTGMTNDMEQRLATHNKGKASKYTRARLPVSLRYVEQGHDRSGALKREREIKALTRKQKERLMEEKQT